MYYKSGEFRRVAIILMDILKSGNSELGQYGLLQFNIYISELSINSKRINILSCGKWAKQQGPINSDIVSTI